MQVQNALVDAHLEAIVGVGALTARRLADAQAEDLGGDADGAGNLHLLLLSLVLQLEAHLLKGLNMGGAESDADLVERSFLDFSTLKTAFEIYISNIEAKNSHNIVGLPWF